MKEILILQNYFGVPSNFYYKGNREYHTFVGILLSMLINISALCLFAVLLSELIKKNNPNVNNIILNNRIGANLTLNTDDLIIAFNVLDKTYKQFNDPTVVRIEFNYKLKIGANGEFISRSTPMTFVNCTEINFKKYQTHSLEEEFLSNSLAQYYCFNGTAVDTDIIVGGLFGSEFYGYIGVDVFKCTNDTVPGVVCKSEEEIDKLLTGCWFEVFFLDHYVDIYNYTSPVQTYSNGIFAKIDPSYLKTMNSFFFQLNVNSNNNFLFNSYTKYSTFKFEKVTNDIVSIEMKRLIALSVISSLNIEIDTRYYIQLTTIAGNVAGILNGLRIILSILLYYFNMLSYKNSLFNSIFDFYNMKHKHLNKIYEHDESNAPIKNKCERYKVNFHVTLRKAIKMNILCINKTKRNEMKQEYQRIESAFHKYVDYVTLIKNQNIIELIRDKEFFGEKDVLKNTKHIDKIEMNVFKEHMILDSKLGLQCTNYNLTASQSKIQELPSLPNLKKIQKDKLNNFIT